MYRVIENRSQEKNDDRRARSRVPKSLREKICKRKMQIQLEVMNSSTSHADSALEFFPNLRDENRPTVRIGVSRWRSRVSTLTQRFPLPSIYNESCETSPGA